MRLKEKEKLVLGKGVERQSMKYKFFSVNIAMSLNDMAYIATAVGVEKWGNINSGGGIKK